MSMALRKTSDSTTGPYPGERQTGEDGQESAEAIGAQELDQFRCRARLVIGQHRGKLGRQRLRWLVRGSARHPQRERPRTAA